MAQDTGHRNTVFLVGAAVLGLVVLSNAGSKTAGRQPDAEKPPSTPKKVTNEPPDYLMLTRAEREVKATLKDPDSAVFSDLRVRRSPLVVCGYVNSRNGFGGMTGRQRFISGSVTAIEEQMEDGAMDEVWNKVC